MLCVWIDGSFAENLTKHTLVLIIALTQFVYL